MARFAQGDAKSFEVLLERYQKPLYSFIFRFIGNRETADEIFQDSLMKVVRAADSYDSESKFSVWLFAIVRNTIFDNLRRQRHRRIMSELDRPLEHGGTTTLGDMIQGVSPDGEEEARLEELQECLDRALEKLNPDQKEVFLMRHYEDLSFKEIADIVGCPVNTAKTRMRYALESLRRELARFI